MRQFFLALSFIVVSLVFAEDAAYFDPSWVGSSAAMIRRAYIQGFSPYASSVFENPAALHRTSRLSTSLFSTTIAQENLYYNAALSLRLKRGVVGFGLMSLGVDDIGKTDLDGMNEIYETGESYQFKNYLMKSAYQFSFLDHVHLGAALTFAKINMDTVDAFGWNADLGFLYEREVFDISLTLKNIFDNRLNFKDTETLLITGGNNSSEGKTEYFRPSWILSGRYQWRDISFFSQFEYLSKDSFFNRHYAIEYNPSYFSFLTLSMGFSELHNPQNVMTASDIKSFFEDTSKTSIGVNDFVDNAAYVKALTYGVGLNILGVNFDYAFEQGSHVESSLKDRHYFSINLYF